MKRGRGAAVCAVRARSPPGCPTARVSGRRPAIGRQPACDSCVFYAVSAPSLGARALLRRRMTVVGDDGASWHYVPPPSPLAHVEFFCYWPIVRCRACPLVNRQLLPICVRCPVRRSQRCVGGKKNAPPKASWMGFRRRCGLSAFCRYSIPKSLDERSSRS